MNYELDNERQEVIIRIPFSEIEKRYIPKMFFKSKKILKIRETILTDRQREILDLIQQGLVNKEISTKLNITVRTVKFHISILLAKFKVASRYQLSDPDRFSSKESFVQAEPILSGWELHKRKRA